MIVASDNGGVGPGNNHPLRGSKMTPWNGGIRGNAFVTGGFIPAELRGTSNVANMHIADWYPTLCNLVGVSSNDTIVMKGKGRPIDGVDVWPLLLSGASNTSKSQSKLECTSTVFCWLSLSVVMTGICLCFDTRSKTNSAREYLPATEYALIWKGRWKLLTNAGASGWYPPALGANGTYNASVHDSFAGWKYPTKANPGESLHKQITVTICRYMCCIWLVNCICGMTGICL